MQPLETKIEKLYSKMKMNMEKKHYLFGRMLGWLLGLLCVGCATGGTEELPQYDPASGMSYYEWLYKDSAFIECEGDPMHPWIEPVPWPQYNRIYNRMARHLMLGDTLSWDFTAEEIKVTPRIYDYMITMWKYDNKLIRSGKFTLKLFNNSYQVTPIGDVSNFDFTNP